VTTRVRSGAVLVALQFFVPAFLASVAAGAGVQAVSSLAVGRAVSLAVFACYVFLMSRIYFEIDGVNVQFCNGLFHNRFELTEIDGVARHLVSGAHYDERIPARNRNFKTYVTVGGREVEIMALAFHGFNHAARESALQLESSSPRLPSRRVFVSVRSFFIRL
jgi:hypothetical protein